MLFNLNSDVRSKIPARSYATIFLGYFYFYVAHVVFPWPSSRMRTGRTAGHFRLQSAYVIELLTELAAGQHVAVSTISR